MKRSHWDTASQGTVFEYGEIPAELAEKAAEARSFMVETAAEANEALMDKYLEGSELSEDEIIAGLRERTLKVEIVPVFCGTAFRSEEHQSRIQSLMRRTYSVFF